MRPTRLFVGVTAIVVLALFAVPLPLVLIGALVLVILFITDASLVPAPGEVTRSVDATVARGRPHAFEITLDSQDGKPRVRQPLPDTVELANDEGSGGLTVDLVAHHRGVYQLGPMAIRHTGPLNLVQRDRTVGAAAELRVFPDLPGGRRLIASMRRQLLNPTGLRRTGPLGLGTDFESIREYSPDDDIRQVNWAASLRAQKPMSNVYRVEQDRDLLCVLDTGRLMSSPVSEKATRLDVCLDALVAVSLAADEMGDRSGAMAFDRQIRRRLHPKRQGAAHVARVLFDIEPQPVEADYRMAFRLLADEKRGFAIVFTDLLDATAARALTDAALVLRRHHYVIVVSCLDPSIDGLLLESPETNYDIARQTVALDLRASRVESVRRLRQADITVVEAPPEQLSAATVRAYLRAKGNARL